MALAASLPSVKSSALFVCDMQEKFRDGIQHFSDIVNVSSRLIKGAKILGLPIIITEHEPKEYGRIVSEIDANGLPTFIKTSFSMYTKEVEDYVKKHKDVHTIIICGIEAHVCVQQTVLDLLIANFNVHVIVDAVSSRSPVDRLYSLDYMKSEGARLTTCESMMMTLVADTTHPKYKDLEELFTEPCPYSGLNSACHC